MKLSVLVSLFCFLGVSQLLGFQALTVSPHETDPQIAPGDEPHFVYVPETGRETGYLFLFYPGTGAAPSDYQRLMETAALMGHHVIGLSYVNDDSINRHICPGSPTPECHRLARLEIHTGEPAWEEVTVDPPNSIEGRLQSLLLHLLVTMPDSGWDAFISDAGTPAWERFIVSGQSQGGGHAGFSAKRHKVARCVMFAATDWWQGAPVPWIVEPGATPPDRLFGFTHVRDAGVPPRLQSPTWVAYGMTNDGGEVIVENLASPFQQSQRLYSTRIIDFSGVPNGNYHNALSVDAALALDPDGLPYVLPVWQYLLDLGSDKPAYDFAAMDEIVTRNLPAFEGEVAVYFYEGDELIYAYEEGIDQQTRLPMASATKWMAGAIILAAAEEGYYYLDDAISRYVPAFDRPGKDGITIRQAFSMTSGMVPENVFQERIQSNPGYTHEASVDLIAQLVPVPDVPGEVIHYWGGGMQAAGLAAVNASGAPDWHALAEAMLLRPLSLNDTAFDSFLPNPAVAGGIQTTGADYLEFLRMLTLNGRAADGSPILATSSVEAFFDASGRDKPITRTPFPASSPFYPYGRQPYYSFGAWVLADNPATGEVEEVVSPGAFGTCPWIDRRRGLHGIILADVAAGSGSAVEPALEILAEMRRIYDQARPGRLRTLSIGGPESGWVDPEINPGRNEIAFQTDDGQVWCGILDASTGELVDGSLEVAATGATPLLTSWNGPEFIVDASGWSLIYNRQIDGLPQLWEARPVAGGWDTQPIFSDNSVARATFLTSQAPAINGKWVIYARDNGITSMLTAANIADPGNEIPLIAFEARQPSHARFVYEGIDVLFATGADQPQGDLYYFELPSGQRTTVYSSTLELGLPVSVNAPEFGGEQIIGAVEGGNSMIFFRKGSSGQWEYLSEIGLPPGAAAAGFNVFSSPEAFVFGGRSFICLNIEKPGTGIGPVEEAQIWLIAPGFGVEDPIFIRTDDGLDPALRTDPEFYVTDEEVYSVYNLVTGNLVYEIERARSGLGNLLGDPPHLGVRDLGGFLELWWDEGRPCELGESPNLSDWETVFTGRPPYIYRLQPSGAASRKFWRAIPTTDYGRKGSYTTQSPDG